MLDYYEIPLDNSPNQKFVVTVPVDGVNKSFLVLLNYNDSADYWMMTIKDEKDSSFYVSNVPLLRAGNAYVCGNLLKQFSYLGIGSIVIAKVFESSLDSPDDKTLGSKFRMIWGGNL